jgi:hypothetical protein
VLTHDRLQGRDGIAQRSQRQHKLGPPFPRHHPQFVEPDGFGRGDWPVGEFGQSGPAPQVKCLVNEL